MASDSLITENKKIETLAGFPSENPNPVLRVDNNYNIVYANKASKKMLRILSGNKTVKTIPEFFLSPVKEAFISNKKLRFVKNIKHYDYLFIIVPIKRTHYVNIYGTDITQEKKAEKAFLESEEKFRTLAESKYRTVIEQSLEAIYLLDPKTKKITEANEAFLKYTGYTKKEIKKLTIYDFVAHDKKSINSNIKSILNYKRSDIGQRLWRRKNGELIDVLVSASSIHCGKDDIIFVTARDITEQKQVEEQLRKSEQKHRMLIETMKEGVIQVNQADIIQFVNEQFCKMVGYSRKELLGKSAANLFLEGTDKVFMGKFKSISEKGSSAQNIVQLRKKDGKFIRALISGSTNYDEHKNTIGSTAVVTDITKIMEYEENLEKINLELNTFIYKASHDLKGPLSSSVGIINMCKENIDDMNILSNLDLISSSLDKLDRILQDLTQITLIRQGQLKIQPIKIKPLLDNIVQTFSHHPDFEKTNVIIEHKLRRPLASDAEILGIIVRNLFENALKYRKIGAENSFIKITTASKNKKIVITIADNGIGIPEKYHKSIYNMFVRASTISWGSGLGLYSVKNAVEKLKGTIKLKSEENKGTTFTLHLPDLDR